MEKECVGAWWRREWVVVDPHIEVDTEEVGIEIDIVVDIEVDTETGTEVGTGFDTEVDTVDIEVEVEVEGDYWSIHLVLPYPY
jgi:hypothetical protein